MKKTIYDVAREYEKNGVNEVFAITAHEANMIVKRYEAKHEKVLSLECRIAYLELELEQRPKKLQMIYA